MHMFGYLILSNQNLNYNRQKLIDIPQQLYQQFMLHQVLCALLGRPGSVIKKYPNEMIVDSSINYLTQPEIFILNQICKSGYYYYEINELINSQCSQNNINSPTIKSASLYRKAMYKGLKIAMESYVGLILSIETQFLKHRHFTFSNIKAELQPFQNILSEIFQIVVFLNKENYRGGVIINYLYHKYQNSNFLVREWLFLMIKQTIKVFLNQVNSWILYGQILDLHGQFFVHKVITQVSEKYKFKTKTGKNIQITDWDMFTLQQFMIPTSLIQLQTAGKILFIGKSIKILRSANKIANIPQQAILEKLNQATSTQYSQIVYEGVMQQIRQIIAKKMIQFIMKQKNLIKQLQKLNSYYLMFKGDFYHHFLQQAKGIETISQKQKAQKKINDVYLPNTFIRLGEEEDMKRLFFEIKPLGFNFSNFKNFGNICPVGNINLIQGKAIRFNSSGSAIWNRTKQIVQNNFTIIFSFNFKKQKQIYSINKVQKAREPTYLNLVIQNSKQITGSSHQNPAYLNRIMEYMCIKFGFEYSQKQQNYVSSVMVVHRNAIKQQKQILFQKATPKTLNFLDNKTYQAKIHYSNDQLKVQLNGSTGQKVQMKIDAIKLGNYLNLQMGRANLGFISTLNEKDFSIDLQQWEMICKPLTYYNGHWSDLSLNFKVEWPINLIITQDLLEIYSRIHKFMFPIRQLQIQLQQIWFQIPKRMKQQTKGLTNKAQICQIWTFERILASLRNQMSLVINNLWAYLHSDIAQSVWTKLKHTLENAIDFQEVISGVNKYVKSIQIMYFFNVSKIQKRMSELIQKSKSFTYYFTNIILIQSISEDMYNQVERMDVQFNEKLTQFYSLLKEISKMNNSQYLYHITKRIQGCIHPKKNQKNF